MENFAPLPLNPPFPRKRTFDIHWRPSLLDHKDCLVAVEKRKFS
jgi:hypothetical protein